MKLQDRIAIVTGASGGIGKAIALQLAAEGATVICNYHSSKQKADEVAQAVSASGGRALVMQGDMKKLAEMEKMAAATVKIR